MALKTLSNKPFLYVPKAEREEKQPTVVVLKPLTKGEFDEYMDSLTEFKRSKVVSKANKAGERLYKKCLHPDDTDGEFTLETGQKIIRKKGVFLYNVYIDGRFIEGIEDRDIAVDFLIRTGDIESANEIESVMKGSSTLDEEEEKNSD